MSYEPHSVASDNDSVQCMGTKVVGKPVRRPVNAASSVSRASASESSPGATRPHRRATAAPVVAATRMRKTAWAWVPAGKRPASMARWIPAPSCRLQVADELEPLPVLADLRDRAIEEHQREILRMRLAEFVDPPERSPDWLQQVSVRIVRLALGRREQDAEPFFGQREEDVVFTGEIAVDRGGAVFDPLGNLADRDVVIALGDEQVSSRIQNGPRNCLPLPSLTFLDSQKSSRKGKLNSVQYANTVRRQNASSGSHAVQCSASCSERWLAPLRPRCQPPWYASGHGKQGDD